MSMFDTSGSRYFLFCVFSVITILVVTMVVVVRFSCVYIVLLCSFSAIFFFSFSYHTSSPAASSSPPLAFSFFSCLCFTPSSFRICFLRYSLFPFFCCCLFFVFYAPTSTYIYTLPLHVSPAIDPVPNTRLQLYLLFRFLLRCFP